MSTVSTIADLLKEMEEDVKDFNKRVTINEITNLDESFVTLGKSFREQFNRLKFERKILDEKVLPFFKYEKDNIHVSKDIVDLSYSMTNRYLKRVEYEGLPNKGASYLNPQNKEFKCGVLEESKNLLVFQYQVGYVNNQMPKECERIFEDLAKKINKRWNFIGKRNMEELEKSMNFWKTVVSW